ncbi:MFS transporter [Leucobacter celer]|uniref:MFS transporter n=1 Tax=Leucobacter celer TaxID=668625 RepID=UPI000A9019FA|nr:MFS transporter [Leucobacter celer]
MCGAFGIGVSEFVVMGLLPQIAVDLEPGLTAASPDAALALTGGLVSGYALGVVVGMVVTPLILRRLSEHRILLLCAAVMLIGTALTAASPNLAVAVVLRFLSALTHASYVGIASALVGRLLGSSHQGRGAAIVVGGLSVANLLGVPVLTALGSDGSWRAVLGVCAALFAVPVVALRCQAFPAAAVPARAADGGGIGSRRLWSLIAVVTVLASGCFAVTTFVAPISDLSQGPGGPVPISLLMLLFGAGMNLGNFGGGWTADRSANGTLLLSGVVGIVGSIAVVIPSGSGLTVSAGVCAVGLSLGLLTPGAQVLYVRTAREGSRLAASLAPGTINLGSFLGAVVGGAGLATAGPAAVGAIAAVCIGAATLLQLLRMQGARVPQEG